MQKTRVSAESCLRGRRRLILVRATLFLAGAKETVRDFAIKLCWVSRKSFTVAIISSMKSKLITCDLKNSKKKNVTVFFANDSTCLLTFVANFSETDKKVLRFQSAPLV